ncbi:hypothetical protein EV421DRAFT_1691191, partial [Armillaria borealis]
MQEVMAILFTGPAKPTLDDFKRTPVLVRRNEVYEALEWLKLNHADYHDIGISRENLSHYPEDMPPVSVEYKERYTNKTPEGISVHNNEEEDGIEDGDCPFIVHGLTGDKLETLTTTALKGLGVLHLNSNGKVLAVGQSDQAESIWKNPQLYPKMF